MMRLLPKIAAPNVGKRSITGMMESLATGMTWPSSMSVMRITLIESVTPEWGISLAAAITLIEESLSNWANQSLVDSDTVADVLLDIRRHIVGPPWNG